MWRGHFPKPNRIYGFGNGKGASSMPKLNSTLPKYQRHRASGKAVVTLYGKDFYLGPHGTKTSKAEYDRLVGEWIAAGRPSRPPVQFSDITIVELAAAYQEFAQEYYQKNETPTATNN